MHFALNAKCRLARAALLLRRAQLCQAQPRPRQRLPRPHLQPARQSTKCFVERAKSAILAECKSNRCPLSKQAKLELAGRYTRAMRKYHEAQSLPPLLVALLPGAHAVVFHNATQRSLSDLRSAMFLFNKGMHILSTFPKWVRSLGLPWKGFKTPHWTEWDVPNNWVAFLCTLKFCKLGGAWKRESLKEI
jgi:hypothetical protein